MMQLQLEPNPKRQDAAVRRLSSALRLEAYFRSLVTEHCAEEVRSQWAAARMLLTRELDDFAPAKPHPAARRHTAG